MVSDQLEEGKGGDQLGRRELGVGELGKGVLKVVIFWIRNPT